MVVIVITISSESTHSIMDRGKSDEQVSVAVTHSQHSRVWNTESCGGMKVTNPPFLTSVSGLSDVLTSHPHRTEQSQ